MFGEVRSLSVAKKVPRVPVRNNITFKKCLAIVPRVPVRNNISFKMCLASIQSDCEEQSNV